MGVEGIPHTSVQLPHVSEEFAICPGAAKGQESRDPGEARAPREGAPPGVPQTSTIHIGRLEGHRAFEGQDAHRLVARQTSLIKAHYGGVDPLGERHRARRRADVRALRILPRVRARDLEVELEPLRLRDEVKRAFCALRPLLRLGDLFAAEESPPPPLDISDDLASATDAAAAGRPGARKLPTTTTTSSTTTHL